MTKVNYKPDGYTDVTPWIIGRDTAGLMDFLARAFGAKEIARLEEGGVIGHAEMRIGDAVVMMFDAPKGDWQETPAFLRLYVTDADATFETAVKAGATPVTKVTHLAFGDRVGRVRDPYGNLYWIQTHIEDLSEAEMNWRWSDPEWAKRMAYVTGSLKGAED